MRLVSDSECDGTKRAMDRRKEGDSMCRDSSFVLFLYCYYHYVFVCVWDREREVAQLPNLFYIVFICFFALATFFSSFLKLFSGLFAEYAPLPSADHCLSRARVWFFWLYSTFWLQQQQKLANKYESAVNADNEFSMRNFRLFAFDSVCVRHFY